MTVVQTLRVAVASRRRTAAHEIGFIIAGAAALAASARLSVEIGPVPITAQTLVVLLIGALQGSLRGGITVASYLLLGVAGAPVFARGGGPGYLFGPTAPTGGYLLGFVAAAFVVGLLLERGWERRPAGVVTALLIGEVIIFAAGLAQLSFFAPAKGLLMAGLVPFLPGEAVKITIAAVVLSRLKR